MRHWLTWPALLTMYTCTVILEVNPWTVVEKLMWSAGSEPLFGITPVVALLTLNTCRWQHHTQQMNLIRCNKISIKNTTSREGSNCLINRHDSRTIIYLCVTGLCEIFVNVVFKQSQTVYTQSVDTSRRAFKVFCENETRWEQQDSGDCFSIRPLLHMKTSPLTKKQARI